MTLRKQVRFLVLLLLTTIFLLSVGMSISEWSKKKVGETMSTKSASEILYPCVTMIPWFELGFSQAKLASYKTKKNLTEYNLKTSSIQKHIMSINQKYEEVNG